jgi:capsular polysaccharide biosynthesis protein
VTGTLKMAMIGPFERRGLAELLGATDGRVSGIETGAATAVPIPRLGLGAAMRAYVPISEPIPDVDTYTSVVPWTCTFQHAVLHGSRGIVRLGGTVVADTVPGPDAEGAHHTDHGEQVMLHVGGTHRRLDGPVLSLISAGPENYWHWTVDALGRVATAPEIVRSCPSVLVPPLTEPFQRAGLALIGVTPAQIVEVHTGDCVAVEELVVPESMHADFRAHPALRRLFRGLADAAPAGASMPRRIYIARRGHKRVLVNEDEVIEALGRYGFVPVQLEDLSLAAQIALFRDAEGIVAPHGAGLTNLLFAPDTCSVLELHLDTYVHWCFRRIAALSGQRYDCVIGRKVGGGESVHEHAWVVSPLHVMAAIDALLGA